MHFETWGKWLLSCLVYWKDNGLEHSIWRSPQVGRSNSVRIWVHRSLHRFYDFKPWSWWSESDSEVSTSLQRQTQIRPLSTFSHTTVATDFLVDIPSPCDVGRPLRALAWSPPRITASWSKWQLFVSVRLTEFQPALSVIPLHVRCSYVELTFCRLLLSTVCYLHNSTESLNLPLQERLLDVHYINTKRTCATARTTEKWCAYFALLDMILDQGSLPLLVISELELRILKASQHLFSGYLIRAKVLAI